MTTLSRVTAEFTKAQVGYSAKWAIPLSNAYTHAHDGASATINEQKALDKAQLELFISLVSIGMTAGIGSMFAKQSFSTFVGLKAAERNLERSFNAVARMQSSPELSHFVSKSWSGIARLMTIKTKNALTKLGAADVSLENVLVNPLIFKNKLEEYVNLAIEAGMMVATDIADSTTLTDEEKSAKYTEMLSSPFLKAIPSTRLFADDKAAGGSVELSWYMAEVMASDRFRHAWVNSRGTGSGMGSAGIISNNPINMRTTDPNYPVDYNNVVTSGWLYPTRAKGEYGKVFYSQQGSAIRKRIDFLYATHCGNSKARFFKGQTGRDELQRAEILYDELTAVVGDQF